MLCLILPPADFDDDYEPATLAEALSFWAVVIAGLGVWAALIWLVFA